MTIDTVRAFLAAHAPDIEIIELPVSSATVEVAAKGPGGGQAAPSGGGPESDLPKQIKEEKDLQAFDPLFGNAPVAWAWVVIAALLVWRHKENIRQLVQGKERAIGR